MRRWLPPFHAELERSDHEPHDIAFGPGNDLLVSRRFATAWSAEGLTGLGGFEVVKLVTLRPRAVGGVQPEYLHVTVDRSPVAIDVLASGLVWDGPVCDTCRVGRQLFGWDRIVLEGRADRTICTARGLPGTLLVDESFRNFCERYAITNAQLVPGPLAGHWF